MEGPCVWYVCKYVSEPRAGETPSRGFALMRELSRLGISALIVTSDSLGPNGSNQAPRRRTITSRDRVRIVRLKTIGYRKSKSLRRLASWIHFEISLLRLPLEELPKPDVVIASSLSLLTVLNGLRLRRRYGSRLVFEVRDIWPLTLTSEGAVSARNPFAKVLGHIERLGYEKSDVIVGTMPNLSQHVKAVTGRNLRVECIPMGVDMGVLDLAQPLEQSYVDEYLARHKFIVGYAGSMGISNALETLFDCAEILVGRADIHFVLVGSGDLRQAYERRCVNLPNVTFAPKVDKRQVQHFLSFCSVLYFAAHDSEVWRYGLSLNKLIDYMLAGKPIVASYSGYPSMINEARCGSFVPAADADALATAILKYRELSLEERERIGSRGRTWLLANRNYSNLALQYRRILWPEGHRSNA